MKTSKQRRTNHDKKKPNSAHDQARAINSNEGRELSRLERRQEFRETQRRRELDGANIGDYIEERHMTEDGKPRWYRAVLVRKPCKATRGGSRHKPYMFVARWLVDDSTSTVDVSSSKVVLLGTLVVPPPAIRTAQEARDLHARLEAADDINANLRAIRIKKKKLEEFLYIFPA